MAKLTKYCTLFFAVCAIVASCSKGEEGPDVDPESRYVQEISVFKAARTAAGSDSDDEKPAPYDGEEIFDVDFAAGTSMLYISQRTRYMNPFQQDNKTYKYVYFNSPNASWEEGFNFKAFEDVGFDPTTQVNPNSLNWDEVGSKGSVGNGFALYAMYYPNQIDGTREVALDQSRLEDLRSSDILGAYHSTSALYSRVRFQLHHLMVYFKVNLYVPVFEETFKTETKEPETQGYSGYTAESLVDALIMQVCPTFTIDWAASISSEGSPAVNLPANYANDLHDIRMYSHAHAGDGYEIEDETAGDGKTRAGDEDGDGDGDGEGGDVVEPEPEPETEGAIRPVKKTRIDIAQFLPKDLVNIQPLDPAEDGCIYDNVYVYSFSVIVPAQYADFTSQNPGFLKFAFKRPSTKTDKNYFFSSGFSSNNQGSVLEPNKGTLQVLNLYLPRKGDEVILIGAEIQDWTDVDTDMNLQPSEDKDKNTDPDDPDDDSDEDSGDEDANS